LKEGKGRKPPSGPTKNPAKGKAHLSHGGIPLSEEIWEKLVSESRNIQKKNGRENKSEKNRGGKNISPQGGEDLETKPTHQRLGSNRYPQKAITQAR